MSLQRIFESARKLGLPVIVTDPAGREPMVVLPLEQFEAMAGAGETREPMPMVAPQPSKPVLEPEMSTILPVSSSSDVASSVSTQTVAPSSGMSLEEGFYLDSVDNQGEM